MSSSELSELNYKILKHLWQYSNEAIFTIGYDGAVLDANPAFLRLLGWNLEELANMALPPFIADMNKQEHRQFLQQIKDGNHFPFEIRKRIHKDGTELSVLASYHALNHKNVLAIVIYKDITKQMNIQKQLRESEHNYRMLIENLSEAVIKINDGKINLINSSGVTLLGKQSKIDVLGHTLWDFVTSEEREQLERKINEVMGADQVNTFEPIVIKLNRYDGKEIWAEINIMLFEIEAVKEVQLVLRDISEERRYESRLKHLAYHDPLTGLKNRTIFTDIISQSIESAKKLNAHLSIMYIDIDHFKTINDTLGHQAGDELLKKFANRLSAAVRQEDVACRIGGDEFLVLLLNVSNRIEVEKIAKRIIDIFRKPFVVENKKVSLTVSIGISIYPEDGIAGRDLIHHADIALYEAKRKRNKFIFYANK